MSLILTPVTEAVDGLRAEEEAVPADEDDVAHSRTPAVVVVVVMIGSTALLLLLLLLLWLQLLLRLTARDTGVTSRPLTATGWDAPTGAEVPASSATIWLSSASSHGQTKSTEGRGWAILLVSGERSDSSGAGATDDDLRTGGAMASHGHTSRSVDGFDSKLERLVLAGLVIIQAAGTSAVPSDERPVESSRLPTDEALGLGGCGGEPESAASHGHTSSRRSLEAWLADLQLFFDIQLNLAGNFVSSAGAEMREKCAPKTKRSGAVQQAGARTWRRNMPQSEPKNQKKKRNETNRARYGQQVRLGFNTIR